MPIEDYDTIEHEIRINTTPIKLTNIYTHIMKAIIIDDDPASVDILAEKLKPYDGLQLVGSADTGEKGVALLKSAEPEVVFLDVELPDMSGLEFLERLNAVVTGWCRIVMYTGHESYMLSSFRNNAYDFLLKPIDDKELEQVVQRLYTSRGNGKPQANDTGIMRKPNEEKLLFYTNSIDFRLVHIRDIGLFQYNHDMRVWEVVVAGRKDPIKLKRNANNESLLAVDPRFIQVSQRYIININYLFEVNDNICRLYPPFDKISYVKVGRLFRKKLIDRFSTL